MAPPAGPAAAAAAAAGASAVPPPMVRRQKPGEAIEEAVQVKRLLSEAGDGWVRMVGDDGEEDRELAFSQGGRYVAVALQGGDVAVWDLHPLPHAVLYLEVPAPLTEDGAPADGYIVTGLSWSRGARKLLVTYRQGLASHICKWGLEAAAVEAHCKCAGVISPAQLSPLDEDLCAYFYSGNALLRLHRLSDDKVVKEADLVEEGGAAAAAARAKAGKDDESVASGSTSQQQVAAASSSSKKQEVLRLGMCAFGEGGQMLFAVAGNRRVLKLEASTLNELKRSPDFLPPSQTQVHKMRMAPSGRLLFVFTNRAAHVLATGSLRASEPLGEFGALKVEWGCWGVGPERNGNGHELVVLGVPSAFSRGDSVQERHFAWRVPDPPVALEEEREEECPLRLEVTPDIIPGFKTGLQALELCPGRALMLACGCDGGLYLRQETFITGFPGSMYAPGYLLLENNRPYIEREDELDRLPPGSVAAVAKEAELNQPSRITTDEAGPVDLSTSPAFDMRAAMLPKPLPRGRGSGDGEVEEEGRVVFPLIMHQRSKRRKPEEEDGEGGESEEEPGGFRHFLPMPAALARKRKAALSGKAGGPSAAQRSAEEWAAHGREALKRRMQADLRREEEAEERRKAEVKERRERERREEQERRQQRPRQQPQQQAQQAPQEGAAVKAQQPPPEGQQQHPAAAALGEETPAASSGATEQPLQAPQQEKEAGEPADDATPHEESKEGQGASPPRPTSSPAPAPAPEQEGRAAEASAPAAEAAPQQQQQQQQQQQEGVH